MDARGSATSGCRANEVGNHQPPAPTSRKPECDTVARTGGGFVNPCGDFLGRGASPPKRMLLRGYVLVSKVDSVRTTNRRCLVH